MRANGFSLLEAVVASAILITGVASLAQLVVAASRARAGAGAHSHAAVFVVDKMEELRALRFTVDADGAPVSDPRLAPSLADALERDTPGYADAPDGFARRWSVQPLRSDPLDTLVLQVRVTASGGVPGGTDVRMTTVRTRRGACCAD